MSTVTAISISLNDTILSSTIKSITMAAVTLLISTTPKPTPAPPGIYWRVKMAMQQVAYGVTAFDFSFVLVCLYYIFTKKDHCRSPYFIMLLFTTAIRGITFLVEYIGVYNSSLSVHWYRVICEIWRGFSIHWHGIIILALALNRGTALGMPFRHQQLWRPRNFAFLCLFILVWPLVPNLFISHLFYCYWWVDRDDGYCRANFIGTFKYMHCVNTIAPIIALILNAITIIKRRSKLDLLSLKKQKIELYLLYQSVFSTITFTAWVAILILSYILQQARKIDKNAEFLGISLEIIANWNGHLGTFAAILYFEGGLIILFIMSQSARESYFGFFGILYICRRIKAMYKATPSPFNSSITQVLSVSPRQ